MKPIDHERRWWQRSPEGGESLFEGDAPAWFVSLVVHAALLVVLSLTWIYVPRTQITLLLEAVDRPTDEQPLERPTEVHFTSQPDDAVGAGGLASGSLSFASAPEFDRVSQLELHVTPVAAADLTMPLLFEKAVAPEFREDLFVKGTAGLGLTGTSGAIDRITQEILLSLERRRTLVVWLFDQSLSLETRRDEVAARFKRIYHELGVIEAGGNEAFQKHAERPLLTSIGTFGKQVAFPTKQPTDDYLAIEKAVRGIENDPSGEERVFTAVSEAARRYRRFGDSEGRYNVMLIVVTDEAGDDLAQLETALSQCRNNAIAVYVIGVPAPFGREEAYMKWVDPDPHFDQRVQMKPVHQGPESVAPECVRLAFVRGDDIGWLDSGFGPYGLTRLCYETGGIYFALHPNRPEEPGYVSGRQIDVMASRINYFFDPGVMRSYRPDYVSVDEYERMLRANKSKWCLVEAARRSMLTPMTNPRTDFPHTDEAQFKRILDEAQRAAAVLEPQINELYALLRSGEDDRARLTEPRWQAGYDLALGRVLALKVRTDSYNGMLAQAKSGLKFANAKNNVHVLRPADEITVGSVMERMAQRAKELLRNVVHDHAGTPWALLAEQELKEPIGWKWSERYQPPPPKRTMGPANNNARRPRPSAPRQLPKPKPVREGVRL